MEEIILEDCTGFDWDKGNLTKSSEKHSVLPVECEQVFFNEPLLLYKDLKHSIKERRAFVLGKTNSGRRLFIAFNIRDKLVRVISARDMSRKERKIYEEI